MARLASQGKLGYYPTPEDELNKIMEMIKIDESNNKIDVLDPCFGDGRALLSFKRNYGYDNVVTYGIELDFNRFKSAMVGDDNQIPKYIDLGFNCDALQEIIVNRNSFDILFLNPPYDLESSDNTEQSIIGKKRLETRFLEKYTDSLIPDGLLIYIVPSNSIYKDFNYLTKKYELISLYAFDEFENFRQVVFIGRRKAIDKKDMSKEKAEEILNWLQELTYVDKYDIQEVKKLTSQLFGIDNIIYVPKAVEKPKVRIFTSLLDPEKMVETIESEPLDNLDGFFNGTKLKSFSINPVQEPREGHLALLTASGLMDGKIENGIYIKGNVEIESTSIDEEQEDGKIKTITTYVPKITLFLYNDIEKKLYEVK